MAPIADYSTTPSDNTSISGLGVTNATVADTLDDIIRQLMADVKAADNANAKSASLGTMSTQNLTAVNIDGGNIDGTVIGATNPKAGAFTSLALGDNTKITWGPGSGGDSVRWSTGVGFIGEENGGVTFRLGPTPFIEGVGTNTTANSANVNVTTAGTLARSTSSGDYKVNREFLADVGEIVDGLEPLSFDSTHEADKGRRFIGFIAEDLSALVPEAAIDGGKNYDIRALVAILAAEVKSLRSRVAALEIGG